MSGYCPDWVRKNYHKVAKMADGGEVDTSRLNEPKGDEGPRQGEDPRGPSFSVQGEAKKVGDVFSAGGRAGMRYSLDRNRDFEVGVSGHTTRGNGAKETKVDGVDLSYRNKNDTFSVSADKDEAGKGRYTFRYRKTF